MIYDSCYTYAYLLSSAGVTDGVELAKAAQNTTIQGREKTVADSLKMQISEIDYLVKQKLKILFVENVKTPLSMSNSMPVR